MTKITIIRHAQSLFNAGLCKDDSDLRNSRLSDFGKQQAANLNRKFDLLILSPLKRAIETYAHSNIKTREIIISDLVREQKEVMSLNYLDFESIEPESIEDIKQRAIAARDYIKTLKSDNIGIISHYLFIAHFLAACGQEVQYPNNTQIITFEL